MKPFINPPHCPSLDEMASPMQPQSANSSRSTAAMRPAEQQQQQQQQGLNCPRCDSSNTKFCYYNNYSLTQPRHYCKTCRRYWTRGGALRNVPIGGGCRKSKKSKSSRSAAASSSSSLSLPQLDPLAGFHLGSSVLPYGYPFSAYDDRLSIESLSSINQDMHWKLQQQRLQAMMMAGADPQEKIDTVALTTERSRAEHSNTATAWFLQSTPQFQSPNASAANSVTAGNTNTSIYTNGDWNAAIPNWSEFTALP